MNHIYHSIWNVALGAWIAVSEIARGQGKRSSNRRKLVASSLLLCTMPVWALPTGEQLVAGQASVSSPSANVMQINQASQNAVINWQGFSIAPSEAVTIQQPNANAALLNRVVGQDASQIQGQINANGQVYLVNPNGVVFGKTAQVDVGGLVASTHNISNADFMNGKNHFTQDGATGSVENHGTINTADGGVVALIAEQVSNTGTIKTPKGTTALAAGKTVDLDFQGNGLVEVKVSEAALNAQITNQGAIQADGGRVILSAKAAGQLIDTVINQQGIIRAQSLVERNGEIILAGGDKGITQNNGTLDTDAQPTASTATGGTIKVTGEHIQINNGATVTASGQTSGGNIQIGDKQNTQQTTLQQHTTVSAKTQNNGKAGTIEILANMHNGTVNVAGKLDASAPTNGDGGYIDTSAAHVNISDSANITTKATNGNTGTWIIDPNDYKIAASGGNITGLTLSNNLKTSNVIISTATQGTAGGNGDIFVNDIVTWSSNLLTLFAERNININAAMNGTGIAQLALRYGQGAVEVGNTSDYFVNAAVNLPAGNNFSTLLGSDGVVKNYTVITQLGAENSLTTTDLQGMSGNTGLNYALGANIDASPTSTWNAGAGFVPVGNSNTSFNGNFDGLGHTITGLTINRPDEDYVGLFGLDVALFGSGGSIRNIGMVAGRVTGNDIVGGLVGYNGGTINNAYATGNVKGNNSVGGLVGSNDHGIINNAYATGSVTGNNSVGGLVGNNFTYNVNTGGIINNAYATGSVTGNDEVGGLVGGNGGLINNAYATGSVTGNDDVGGLVGNGGIINNAYATGSVTGNDAVGGLVGRKGTIINDSYATGNVTGNSDVGGLFGWSLFDFSSNYYNSNSHYNIDKVLINGSHFVTLGGLYNAQYQDWMSHNKTLNISNYATTLPLDTASGYYGINNLQSLRDLLGFADNPNYKFRLNTNIDLASTSGFFIPVLAGEFDGAGHILSNFTLNQPFNSNIGFFGVLVRTIGTVSSPFAFGSILAPKTSINVSQPLININLSQPIVDNINILFGTVVTYTTASIKNLGLSNITITGNSEVGGLVGRNTGNISNSYATGKVSGIYDVGGLVGINTRISEGGGIFNPKLVFYGGEINNAYANGSVSGSYGVGGLLGTNFGIINNAYANSSVSGNSYVGGLVGDGSGSINNAYATGSVRGIGIKGGLVGGNYANNITNSFWDTQTTGQPINGVGSGDSTGVTGKTTAEMKQLATFKNAGWDITDSDGGSSVWWMYEGFSPPLLRAFLPPIISHGLLYTFLVSKAENPQFFPINTVLNSGNNIGFTLYGSGLNFWLSQLSILQTTGTFSDTYKQQFLARTNTLNADLAQYQGELYQLIGYEWQTKRVKP